MKPKTVWAAGPPLLPLKAITCGESNRNSEINCKVGSEYSEAFSCNSVGCKKKRSHTPKETESFLCLKLLNNLFETQIKLLEGRQWFSDRGHVEKYRANNCLFFLSLAIKILSSFKREASHNQSFLYPFQCRLCLISVTGFEKRYHIEATSHAKYLLNNEAQMKMYHISPLKTPFPLTALWKASFIARIWLHYRNSCLTGLRAVQPLCIRQHTAIK